MTTSRETYTPGYSDATLRLMLERTAAKHAAFFTPFLQRGMRLLDCGCGPGTITIDLAKLVSPGQVFGIDLEPGQVRCAQDRARQKQSKASFEVAGKMAILTQFSLMPVRTSSGTCPSPSRDEAGLEVVWFGGHKKPGLGQAGRASPECAP